VLGAGTGGGDVAVRDRIVAVVCDGLRARAVTVAGRRPTAPVLVLHRGRATDL
jgi:hypothetical protein